MNTQYQPLLRSQPDIAALARTGYLTVAYPPASREVGDALAAWERFGALGQERKSTFPYGHNGVGVGYQRKDGSGSAGDRKEIFDVAAAHLDWLSERAAEVGPEAVELTRSAIALAAMIKPTVVGFARSLERAYGLAGLGDEVESSDGAYFTRFIRYGGERKAGEEIATAHIDQSGFTLHLFESAPGFQLLGRDLVWRAALFPGDETLIIPSMQLQLRSKGKLEATCHRVVATRETATSGRVSAVCFVRIPGPRKDEARCGRLQEWKPGFNYGMEHADFAKLFTEN
jgi:isopenicillin N synthase-like dioxygenase